MRISRRRRSAMGRAGLTLLGAAALLGATAGAAEATIPPPAPVQVGVGNDPHLIVDAAGTAHVTWSSYDSPAASGGQPDGVHYCRFKRGASACDTGPTPVYRPIDPLHPTAATTESGGPQIVQIGTNLGLLTRRDGSPWPTPGGGTTLSPLLLYTSSNGGTTFTGPAIVGDADPNGGAVGFGPIAAPTIGVISDGVTGGTYFHGINGGSFSTADPNLGDHATKPWFDGTLAVDGNTPGSLPVAAFKDGGGGDGPAHIQIRKWNGTSDINNVNSWTQPLSIPGDSPQLVGGAGGLFLLQTVDGSGQLFVRKITAPTTTNAGSAGALVQVTNADNVIRPRLVEDAGGHLTLFWQQPDGIYFSSSSDGTTWSPAAVFRADAADSITDMQAAATSDGGGFVIYRINEGSFDGPIVVQGFGTQTPSGQLGLGDLPGGGTIDQGGSTPPVTVTPPQTQSTPPEVGTVSECGKVTFGKVIATMENGCFIPGSGSAKTFVQTKTTVDVNGLLLVPDPGDDIGIDPAAHRIRVTDDNGKPASLTVEAGGVGSSPVVLWHGPLDVTLGKKDSTGDTLFDFSMSKYQATIKGFPVKGDIPVLLSKDGLSVSMTVQFKLPVYFGGITGSATLTAKNGAGFSKTSFKIGPITDDVAGVLEISNLQFSYASDPGSWSGGGKIEVPGLGSLTLNVTVGENPTNHEESFKGKIALAFPDPGVPLTDDVYLQGVSADVGFNPGSIGGGLTIGAVPIGGTNIVTINGNFEIKFSGQPTFHLDGSGALLGVQFATAYLDLFTSPAGVSAGSTFGIHLASNLGFDLTNTFAFSASDFDAKISANACAPLLGCAGLSAEANKSGISLCTPFFAITDTWEHPIDDFSLGSCDDDPKVDAAACNPGPGLPPLTDDQVTICLLLGQPVGAAARAQIGARLQAGMPSDGYVTTVPAGANSEVITLKSNSGVPSPRMFGPDKQAVVFGTQPSGNVAIQQPATHTTTVLLHGPKPGVYAVAPVAGTPVFSSVTSAAGYPAPKVKGSVSGKGKRRTIKFSASGNSDGQTIQLVEQAKGISHVIAKSIRGSGTASFHPAAGPGGRRIIVAQTIRGGLIQYTTTVAHYIAPAPPKLGRVSGLKVTAKGTSVKVSFKAATAARRYFVTITAGNATTMQIVKAPKHQAAFTLQRALAKGAKVKATVRAVGTGPKPGAAVRGTSR